MHKCSVRSKGALPRPQVLIEREREEHARGERFQTPLTFGFSIDLRSRLGKSFFGPSPLSFPSPKVWSKVHGYDVSYSICVTLMKLVVRKILSEFRLRQNIVYGDVQLSAFI